MPRSSIRQHGVNIKLRNPENFLHDDEFNLKGDGRFHAPFGAHPNKSKHLQGNIWNYQGSSLRIEEEDRDEWRQY